MIDKYFNKEEVSKMTFKEFKEAYEGNSILAKYRVDLKDAFKQLGGKMKTSKK